MKKEELVVGMKDSMVHTVTSEDIYCFAGVSHDTNPVHVNESFAKTTAFGQRIAHGMLSASYISAVLGNKIPGNGCIYLGQTLSFKAPCLIGDTITTTAEIVEIKDKGSKAIVTLHTFCTNQNGVVITDGQATVMVYFN